MRQLHIVQGGIDNGDKRLLEKAAKNGLGFRSWVAPKSVSIGDDVVIYISGYGFFATAIIKSSATPRLDWPNRYGAGLTHIKLIVPAISLTTIRRRIPDLTWANYPRSITTASAEVATQIRELVRRRHTSGVLDLDDDSLTDSSLDELRSAALLQARPSATQGIRKAIYRLRSRAIHLYVIRRAKDRCEGCHALAPFQKPDGSGYLEPHHTTRLADEGPDHPAKVIALCPNCHRRAHYGADAEKFNSKLSKKLRTLEPLGRDPSRYC